MTARYRRTPGAAGRRIGAALFLASPGRGTLLRVSSSVAAVWNLLERPIDSKGIVRVFRAAFPAIPLDRLRADLAMILDDLVSEGLLERVATRPRTAHRRRTAHRSIAGVPRAGRRSRARGRALGAPPAPSSGRGRDRNA